MRQCGHGKPSWIVKEDDNFHNWVLDFKETLATLVPPDILKVKPIGASSSCGT